MARGLARDHDDKRIAIRKGAARHFARHGYDRASMTALARSCGVSKALIYHYYDSKEALLFDILEAHLGALLGSVEQVPRPGDDPPAELRSVLRAILSAYRDADAEHQVQIDALGALPAERRAPLVDIQRRLVRHLGDAIAAVAPLPEDRRRPVTMAVFGMLNWFYMWHRPGRDIGREAYADLVADMVLGGLPALLAEAAPERA